MIDAKGVRSHLRLKFVEHLVEGLGQFWGRFAKQGFHRGPAGRGADRLVGQGLPMLDHPVDDRCSQLAHLPGVGVGHRLGQFATQNLQILGSWPIHGCGEFWSRASFIVSLMVMFLG